MVNLTLVVWIVWLYQRRPGLHRLFFECRAKSGRKGERDACERKVEEGRPCEWQEMNLDP